MTRRPIAWLLWGLMILPLVVLGIGGAWFASSTGLHPRAVAAAADMSQEEFGRRVRDYLLAHPEVIGDALNRLESKQAELNAAAASAAVKDQATEIFRDPDSPVSGNPNGEVTLVEFFDYNCPYCRAMAPMTGQAEKADPWLRVVYKEFPILGQDSVFAARAALAAARQGKYVDFHRALYETRGHIDVAKVLEVAKAVGLDVEKMKTDMRDPAISAILEKNLKLAQALHITGTPGFVVRDQVTTGATNFDGLQALIAKGRSSQKSAK